MSNKDIYIDGTTPDLVDEAALPPPQAAVESGDDGDASTADQNVKRTGGPLGIFGKYLTIWVALSMAIGIIIGHFAPDVGDALEKAQVEQISIPISVLLWFMIFPMLLRVEFAALKKLRHNLKPVILTTGINYFIQPFTMYGLAMLFFKVAFANILNAELQNQFVSGAILLGSAPCTAMVLVWSYLVNGDATYTLVQVAVNDLLIFALYVPIVMLLLQITSIPVPWGTIFVAVGLFLGAPGLFAIIFRYLALKYKSREWLEKATDNFEPVTMVALLLTIVFIFILQGDTIINEPIHVLLIFVPLTIQTYLVYAIAYATFYYFKIPFKYSAPAAMIAASNFFELSVAVAMSLYGAQSGATLVTTVGVLEEVPIMLSLVWFCNKTKGWFEKFDAPLPPAKVEFPLYPVDSAVDGTTARQADVGI